MKSLLTAAALLMALAPLAARPQSDANGSTVSLGALARKLKAERKGQRARPAKLYTNDNIPHHGGITVTGSPEMEDSNAGSAGRKIPCLESDLAQQTPEKYYIMTRLQPRKLARGAGRFPGMREARSAAARDAFKRECPCPATGNSTGACRGYVIDHIQPLACGGADKPGNMAWQTVVEGKAKDKWERKACGE